MNTEHIEGLEFCPGLKHRYTRFGSLVNPLASPYFLRLILCLSSFHYSNVQSSCKYHHSKSTIPMMTLRPRELLFTSFSCISFIHLKVPKESFKPHQVVNFRHEQIGHLPLLFFLINEDLNPRQLGPVMRKSALLIFEILKENEQTIILTPNNL